MKDWLTTEIERNKRNGEMFTGLLRKAFSDKKDLEVIIAHHLTIEYEGKLATVDEIPSADTMLFDHDIMKAVFGVKYRHVMSQLAVMPVDGGARDELLKYFLEAL